MSDPIRWGILSTGNIAHTFAADLVHAPGAQLAAVASRDGAKAEAFAKEFGAARAYGAYTDLSLDPEVDAVYVASPHPWHMEHTLACLDGGKAVLCEKPFALNAAQGRAMIGRARERKGFLMEAMWTRFLPLMGELRQRVAAGAVGEVRMITADFGFRGTADTTKRWLNLELGGGALLDVGVYTIALAEMLCGTPENVTGLAHLGESGADEQAAMVLAYAGGRLASLTCAVRTSTPQEAAIYGTEGAIHIAPPFWHPTAMTIVRDGTEERVERPYEGRGYWCEAAEVQRCLQEGLLESPIMPHASSLAILDTMDTLRAQWGLRYPGE